MRFHDRCMNLKFKSGTKRPDKSNAIDMLCSGQVPPKSEFEVADYESKFEDGHVPTPFTLEEREDWLKGLSEVAVASDAFVSSLLPLFHCSCVLIACFLCSFPGSNIKNPIPHPIHPPHQSHQLNLS